jgi:hypothetical protein
MAADSSLTRYIALGKSQFEKEFVRRCRAEFGLPVSATSQK